MKLLSSQKAEGELIGHVIILGITIIGISMITLYGVPSIYSLEDMANLKNVEQAFTVMDSSASRAILGESPQQIANINLGGGSLTVEPNSPGSPSYIAVNSSSFNIIIPMGKVKYQLGDRIVAYEGGGLWSKYPSGSVMLSPPEFQFNGVMLMLPVIDISGNASVGGKGTATVSFKKKNATLVLYPNTSLSNPVSINQSSKVYVNVTSDFYDAWADYARSLAYTNVVENPATHTTGIELTVLQAESGAPSSITDPIVMAGIDPTILAPLENFSFRLVPFKNDINWDIRAGAGKKKLIFHFKGTVKDPGNQIDLNIGYWEGNNSYTETWEGANLFTSPTGEYVDVDLLNKSVNLTYKDKSVGSDNSKDCQPFGTKINGITDTDFSWDNLTINTTNANKTQSLYNITQHYIQKMAQKDIYFNQCSPGKKGDKAPSSASTMLLNYNGTGTLYLHVSENRADVGIS